MIRASVYFNSPFVSFPVPTRCSTGVLRPPLFCRFGVSRIDFNIACDLGSFLESSEQKGNVWSIGVGVGSGPSCYLASIPSTRASSSWKCVARVGWQVGSTGNPPPPFVVFARPVVFARATCTVDLNPAFYFLPARASLFSNLISYCGNDVSRFFFFYSLLLPLLLPLTRTPFDYHRSALMVLFPARIFKPLLPIL